MEHYAGIDVSLERSSVCVVDATGRIVREAKVRASRRRWSASSAQLGVPVTRIGLEAGPLSQWLHAGLTGAGFEAVLLETRQVKAALSAMVVKTDRKDARGIAQLLRMGWFRPVHCKSPPAQEVRALLVGRKLLQGKLLDVELSIRGILRGFGLKVGEVSKGRFAARVRELVAGQPMLERVIEPMLRAREALRAEYQALHRAVLAIVREDAVCRRLMTRAGRRRAGGDHLHLGGRRPGPVPRARARSAPTSGSRRRSTSPARPTSPAGSARWATRWCGRALYEAANVMLTRAGRFSTLKRWALEVAEAPGHEAGQGGARPQAGDRPASDVGRRQRVPLRQGGAPRRDRLTRRKAVRSRAESSCSTEVPSPGRGSR